MGNCHSHNILSGCMFVENVAVKVGVVAKRRTVKGKVDKEENDLFMQLV